MSRVYRLRQLTELYGKRNNSRLIVALDITRSMYEPTAIENMLPRIGRKILGVKIGVPTIFSFGLDVVTHWIDMNHDFLWIADVKLADVGHIGKSTVEILYEAGFDAVIIHGFIGFRKGVSEVVSYASELGISPILVAAMSHPGGEEYINRFSADIVLRSLEEEVEGYILPATYPSYIRLYRRLIGDRVIFSPGVGRQGAEPGSAIEAGADAEIVGRLIYMADDPIRRVDELHGVLVWRR